MTLFDVPISRSVPPGEWVGRARATDPETSVESARSISGRTERLILAAMSRSSKPDWTADDLCAALGSVFPPTLKSALSRLANHNLIELTGALRDSDRGRPAQVYRINRRND